MDYANELFADMISFINAHTDRKISELDGRYDRIKRKEEEERKQKLHKSVRSFYHHAG